MRPSLGRIYCRIYRLNISLGLLRACRPWTGRSHVLNRKRDGGQDPFLACPQREHRRRPLGPTAVHTWRHAGGRAVDHNTVGAVELHYRRSRQPAAALGLLVVAMAAAAAGHDRGAQPGDCEAHLPAASSRVDEHRDGGLCRPLPDRCQRQWDVGRVGGHGRPQQSGAERLKHLKQRSRRRRNRPCCIGHAMRRPRREVELPWDERGPGAEGAPRSELQSQRCGDIAVECGEGGARLPRRRWR